ncbi:MAG: 30S ribosomal protein S21 [marine benthic group bacterium]|nr:30S ribosomal protein S21 [Gemmatimonadota bacterium]MCL7958065.1 30S ribosomal protein S21 [Gemmatimonadota bacterium]MCL7963539.1 30S ribosomal protein S21 [Candidatus Carthagonibacter metallireducens]MCL7980604.1 30S ribosomal protein S21 [Gemmatimonadota bacterium]
MRTGAMPVRRSRYRRGERVLEIQIAEGQNLEKALRQFRRKVQRAGILADMRRKRHYEKPSEAKRRKQKAAQRRLARNARRRKQRS